MIVVLAGGVGAARFLQGLIGIVPQQEITILSNTGDDAEFFGLHVSPDIDIVIYTLAGIVDQEKGWGIVNDGFHVLDGLRRLGEDTWFNLGDRDLATSLYRTRRLQGGASLTSVTAEIVRSFGLDVTLLPMSDDPVATILETDAGPLAFQEYFVRRGTKDEVRGIRYSGAAKSKPAPGLLDAIVAADGIVLAPSNPFLSIGPILAVPGVRNALRAAHAPVAAISPILGGAAIKGPAARLLRSLGHEVSARGVAALYSDFVDLFILDRVDADLAASVRALGMDVTVADTVMRGPYEKTALARATLTALGIAPF